MGVDPAISGKVINVSGRAFKLNAWDPSQDPVIGPIIGLDTETERFVAKEFPPVVLMQVTAGHLIDLVHWKDIPVYLDKMLRYNPTSKIVFVNAAYDLGVLDRKDLYDLVEEERIIDMMDRYKLWEISERGWVRKPASLQGMARNVLRYDVPKDDALRLHFTRARPASLDQLH